jgi:hypothetical protein
MTHLNITFPARFEPLAALLKGRYKTTSELAERWRYSEQTLRNARANETGLPYVALPTGGIRYLEAEIIAAELAGTRGPLSVHRVALELAAMPEVPEALAAAIVARLRIVQGASPG